MRPPNVPSSWDELEYHNNTVMMAEILAYDQVRSHEEFEQKKQELECIAGSKFK